MKVVLFQNVVNLGDAYDVVEVAPGYARNFLFPQKLAKPATKEAVSEAEAIKKMKTRKAEADLKKTEETVARLDGYELEIAAKTNKEGSLFAAITPKVIAEELNKKDFGVKLEQIKLEHPIKETGEFEVIISFAHGLEATIRLIIKQE